MFQRGSHWVSARMSEVWKPGVPQLAAREQAGGEEKTSVPDATEDVGAKTPPPVVSLLPGGVTENDRSQDETLPIAADLDRDDRAQGARTSPPKRPDSRSAPSARTPRAGDAPSASAATTGEARKVGNESPAARTSVVEKQRDKSRERRVPHIALAAVGILAAVAVGPAGTSVPQEGHRVANIVPVTIASPTRGPALPEFAESSVENVIEASRPAPSKQNALQERAPANEKPAADALSFKDAALCTDARCKTLLVHRPHDVRRPMLQPALGAAVGIVDTHEEGDPSVIRHGAVLMTPVPAETAVSTPENLDAPREGEGAEQRVLQIPLDDLGEIEFVLLPKDGPDTARARVALMQRDGGEIARFDLRIDHTLIGVVPEAHDQKLPEAHDQKLPEAQPNAPAAHVDDENEQQKEKDEEPRSGAADEEVNPRKLAVERLPAVRPTKRTLRTERKTAPRRARNSQPVKQPAKKAGLAAREPMQQRPSVAPQPRGLFPLQPLPSSQPTPASREAAPTMQKKKAPEVSSNDLASQPTPRTVGQAPGFETLMSLGGGFALDSP